MLYSCELINALKHLLLINGKKEKRKICEFGINLDERIADGYYFVKSVQLLQYIFDNPKLVKYRVSYERISITSLILANAHKSR